MKIFTTTNLILITLLMILSGCIVQSRQLNGLLELIKEPPVDLSDNIWSARYSDYESTVYAVSTSEGIVFSNNFGDQVLFDGWTLRRVQGMGRHKLRVSISDNKNIRSFKKGNSTTLNHRCNQWEQQKNRKVVRYTQVCSNKQSYKNTILVRKNGDISLIRQIIDEKYTALTLTKLN